MYSVGRDVAVADATAERALLSLIGPRAAEIACSAAAAGVRQRGGRRWPGSRRWRSAPATGSTSSPPPLSATRLLAALLDAGAVEVSAEAVEIVRVEAGVPRFGAEMDARTMPAEASIVEDAVCFTKGCYIGQETVARLHYKGKPNRHLRGLKLSGAAAPGAPLRLGEKEVGTLGGAVVSPAFGPIGLAIVRREAEPGTELTVGEDGVTAEVVALPFG